MCWGFPLPESFMIWLQRSLTLLLFRLLHSFSSLIGLLHNYIYGVTTSNLLLVELQFVIFLLGFQACFGALLWSSGYGTHYWWAPKGRNRSSVPLKTIALKLGKCSVSKQHFVFILYIDYLSQDVMRFLLPERFMMWLQRSLTLLLFRLLHSFSSLIGLLHNWSNHK